MDPSLRDELFPSARVFCNPALLEALQNSPHRPFPDSKTLVDLELRHEPDVILNALSSLSTDPSKQEYHNFLTWAFKDAETSDSNLVRRAVPPDYTPQPPLFMSGIAPTHPSLHSFVMDIKNRWSGLCRVFVREPANFPGGARSSSRSSLIPLPHPFFIPGGRFRECYYWDTLWIVKGLVACDMVESAKGAVRNLLYLVNQVGFVPNGNRVYYLNRSQPPTLTEAVRVVFDALENTSERMDWLGEAVPILDKEYESFSDSHSVSRLYRKALFDDDSLSVYYVKTSHARPESYREDSETVQKKIARGLDESTKLEIRTRMYQDLAAGAESGWDYSSRWFHGDSISLGDIKVQHIVPCCLNSILLKAEKDMSAFHELLSIYFATASPATLSEEYSASRVRKHEQMQQRYRSSAAKRRDSMMKYLWKEQDGFWFDFDTALDRQTETISCAGIMPLWAGCWEGIWDASSARKFVEYVMNTSGLWQSAGLTCTTTPSTEQWDYPNCWPPLVDFAVSGLQRLSLQFPRCGAAEAAEEIAMRFVHTAHEGWLKDAEVHEKYDCRSMGKRGEGGEYLPQTGFGWTNGTILWLLREYADAIESRAEENWF